MDVWKLSRSMCKVRSSALSPGEIKLVAFIERLFLLFPTILCATLPLPILLITDVKTARSKTREEGLSLICTVCPLSDIAL